MLSRWGIFCKECPWNSWKKIHQKEQVIWSQHLLWEILIFFLLRKLMANDFVKVNKKGWENLLESSISVLHWENVWTASHRNACTWSALGNITRTQEPEMIEVIKSLFLQSMRSWQVKIRLSIFYRNFGSSRPDPNFDFIPDFTLYTFLFVIPLGQNCHNIFNHYGKLCL